VPGQVPELRSTPSVEQQLVANRARDDARHTRSTLTDSVTKLAEGVADRFGIGSDRLLEQWRWTPPSALRAPLWALAQLGRPISDGDAAFTAASWARGGVKLPGNAHEQYAGGVAVDATQLRPGDLVAFGPEGSDHVGLYVGEGVMVHVSQRGQPVQVDGYNPVNLAAFSRPGQPSALAPNTGFLLRPVPGQVNSPFGTRVHPVTGEVRVHTGVDLAAREGEPVHAAADGVVVETDWKGGYGNAVMIDHGNGLSTLYGHNSRFAAAVGDRVRAGDVIAYAGATGVATGPHVHFEVRVNGQPVDPMPYRRIQH